MAMTSPDIDWARLHIQPVAHYWFLESMFLIFMLIVTPESSNAWLTRRAGDFVATTSGWLSALFFLHRPLAARLRLAKRCRGYLCCRSSCSAIGCRRFADEIADSRNARNTAALHCICLLAAASSGSCLPAGQQRNSAIGPWAGPWRARTCVFLLHTRDADSLAGYGSAPTRSRSSCSTASSRRRAGSS